MQCIWRVHMALANPRFVFWNTTVAARSSQGMWMRHSSSIDKAPATPPVTHRTVCVLKHHDGSTQEQGRVRKAQQQRRHGLALGHHAEAGEECGVDGA
eukprot:1144446-Pelagomonas_calceolata.AAC.5